MVFLALVSSRLAIKYKLMLAFVDGRAFPWNRWSKKRSVIVRSLKTSVTLENEFWLGLKEIARARQMTLGGLVNVIEAGRQHNNLSLAIRLFVLNNYREMGGR